MASWVIGGSTGVPGLQRLKAARPRGYTHLPVDGNFLPTTAFPRIDRFKEHAIELPVASLDVTPANEAALHTALTDALTHGKGVVHVLSNLVGGSHHPRRRRPTRHPHGYGLEGGAEPVELAQDLLLNK